MSGKETKDKTSLAHSFGDQAEPQARPASVLVVDEQQNLTREQFDRLTERLKHRDAITLVVSDEVKLDARTMAREKFERRLLGTGSNINILSQKPN